MPATNLRNGSTHEMLLKIHKGVDIGINLFRRPELKGVQAAGEKRLLPLDIGRLS